MFITREMDYAVRIVRALADMEIRQMKTICEQESVPTAYAYKILGKLEEGGLTQSVRGVKGGYRLVRTPDKITLLDILKAAQRELYLNDCMREGFDCPHKSGDSVCRVHCELRRIQNILHEALKEKTMADIMNEN